MLQRFEPHSHSMYSNIRLLDSINRPEALINKAIKQGLSGIALTDHETLAGHVELNIFQQKILEEHPDFKIGFGNEIYLCGDRSLNQKYYHFILIAKNKDGHKALRELSSRAWLNSYWDRGLERVVTTYDDLREIYNKYPNSLIATSACLGGELSSACVKLKDAETTGDIKIAEEEHEHIVNFVLFCKEIFGDDFYIECAPGRSKDQIIANKRLKSIAEAFQVKMIIGCDAHYLNKEDRYVHKAYLNSKGGEREVDSFYEFAYLQNEEEIFENLKSSYEEGYIKQMFDNSLEIYSKIENFSLLHKQVIPKVEVKDYPKQENKYNEYPTLSKLYSSDDIYNRYWVNQCIDKLKENKLDNKKYLDRLEYEADIKQTIGEKLETNMFCYPITLQHYVDLFWQCGSTVGAGRGSSCSGLNHYLLGITQLDPLKWDLPFWRYLNKERLELGDIDLDLCPSKRPAIIKAIKKERGQHFNENIDDISKQNLGCTQISTFGTESSKSAILTACRGYRSEEYPDGIDVDIAQYLSSLVPIERGNVWPLSDVAFGDPDKGRKKVTPFVTEVEQYPGLLDIMLAIEGLVKSRGIHASGVILFDNDPYEFGCFMRAPSGEVVTQYDLHMDEAAGMTKYDFLVTDVQDKLCEGIRLLQENGEIEKDLTLREVYNKYFHPSVLPINEDKYWKALQENKVINIFQFDADDGRQAAKKIKPRSILEMSDANGLMRLMTGEKGGENPIDKYVRFKNNINLWYDEMKKYGLTEKEQEILKPYFLKSHGVPPSQEQLMMILMDENICGFTLAEANEARKIVGKKQMSKIPQLKEKVLKQAKSPWLGQYVWDCGIGPQMGYSFSIIHALAYSFIGFQTMYIATRWNPIYWNTACLVVNSGSLEEKQQEEEVVSLYEPEDTDNYIYVDLPDKSGKKKVEKGTDYAKIAKALGDIIQQNIKVSLVDINKSDYSFKPDVENNEILFGLKALSGISGAVIEQIKCGRPYKSLKDFMKRCPLNKTAMLSLIKGGAFDKVEANFAKELNIHPRYLAMVYYILQASELKTKLNLQNFSSLINKDLIPPDLTLQKQIFLFNKYLKANMKVKEYYKFDDNCFNFYSKYFDLDKLNIINSITYIPQKTWDKIYQVTMDEARNWLKNNQEQVLKVFNLILFKECWNKYAQGNLSSWEMESLCFYYNKHELYNLNKQKYGVVSFFDLSYEPEVDYFFKRNGRDIPIYKTYRIVGTVISKNDNKSSITLLTTEGVVNVKFTREYYAMFGKQISEKQDDGTKKVMEKGWFKRGTKVMVTGYRREDMFVGKTYKNTPGHQLYKISKVFNNGKDIELIHERYGVEENE